MNKNNKKHRYIKTVDEIIKIPDRKGNGILKYMVSVDNKGKLARYNLAYINPRLCGSDNGRVIGYDNAHGYHHRHFMGKEERIEFDSYEAVAERFDKEWRELHEKAYKTYH